MTHAEQQAFIAAYERNVNDVPRQQVEHIIDNYFGGVCHYQEGTTSVIDALLMWNEAVKFKLLQEVAA
jgi:hypothetical protein